MNSLSSSLDKDKKANISTAPRVEEDVQSSLATLIRPEFPGDDGVYKHALEILSSLEATPSCGRVATAGLLNSCQEIDGTKKDAELRVQNLKSVYAAQLAICEISETGLPIPQACHKIAIRHASTTGPIRTSNTGSRQIGECLQALEAKPQWWTSYSNSRQNAVTLCQAARSDIDRGTDAACADCRALTIADEFVKLNRKIVDTQSEAHAALSKAAKVSHEQLDQFRTHFIQYRRAFQDQLVKDLDIASIKTQTSFEGLTAMLATAMETAMNALKSVSSTAESQMEGLAMVRLMHSFELLIIAHMERILRVRRWRPTTSKRASEIYFKQSSKEVMSLPTFNQRSGRRTKVSLRNWQPH